MKIDNNKDVRRYINYIFLLLIITLIAQIATQNKLTQVSRLVEEQQKQITEVAEKIEEARELYV